MKIHKVLTDAVTEACQKILQNGDYASYILPLTLAKDKRFGSRDRRFMAETILYVIKNYRILDYISGDKQDFESIVAHAIYLEQKVTPDFLTPLIDEKSVDSKIKEAKEIGLKYSFPVWLDELLTKDLGKAKWKKEAEASHQKALTYLRVNASKCSVANCLKSLQEAGIDCELTADLENCIQLNKRADIRQLDSYKNGWIEVQDAGSQLIGVFLDARPNERIIDACAGAGGKTLQLADSMKNLGKIIAMDVEKKKLEELKKRAERNGFSNIKTHLHEDNTHIKYASWADRLLIDAPCSGLGVLKRNPDDKWKLTAKKLQELIETQQTILQEYSKMLKVGGTLVYATCSIFSEENQEQIKRFLAHSADFELIEEKQTFPSAAFDGFYMAKLTKKA